MKTRSWEQYRGGAINTTWKEVARELLSNKDRSGNLGECSLGIGRQPMDGSNFPVFIPFFLLRSREMEGQLSQPP